MGQIAGRTSDLAGEPARAIWPNQRFSFQNKRLFETLGRQTEGPARSLLGRTERPIRLGRRILCGLGRRTHRPPRHWQSRPRRPAPPPRRCSSPAPCLPRRAAFSAHPEIRLPLFCLETFFETATAISREGGPAKFLMWWKVWPSVTGGGDESSVVAMTKPGSCAARPDRFIWQAMAAAT